MVQGGSSWGKGCASTLSYSYLVCLVDCAPNFWKQFGKGHLNHPLMAEQFAPTGMSQSEITPEVFTSGSTIIWRSPLLKVWTQNSFKSFKKLKRKSWWMNFRSGLKLTLALVLLKATRTLWQRLLYNHPRRSKGLGPGFGTSLINFMAPLSHVCPTFTSESESFDRHFSFEHFPTL